MRNQRVLAEIVVMMPLLSIMVRLPIAGVLTLLWTADTLSPG